MTRGTQRQPRLRLAGGGARCQVQRPGPGEVMPFSSHKTFAFYALCSRLCLPRVLCSNSCEGAAVRPQPTPTPPGVGGPGVHPSCTLRHLSLEGNHWSFFFPHPPFSFEPSSVGPRRAQTSCPDLLPHFIDQGSEAPQPAPHPLVPLPSSTAHLPSPGGFLPPTPDQALSAGCRRPLDGRGN